MFYANFKKRHSEQSLTEATVVRQVQTRRLRPRTQSAYRATNLSRSLTTNLIYRHVDLLQLAKSLH